MCGIFGYLSHSGNMPDEAVLALAVKALVHRGPDEEGSYFNNNCFLGMRRLNIIDLSSGSQPIWNENRTSCIVFNGEIYNYRDIRPELEAKGHTFRSHSDTEVILHAYEEWGVDCLQRLNGMFAFAIWDDSSQTLFIARDRIGEKPLYYYTDDQRLAFASEIKSILAIPSIPRRLRHQSLVNFLSFGHAVAPDTIYEDIFKLLPGHYLLVRNGQLDIKQYWDLGAESYDHTAITSEAEYQDRIRHLLDDSVRRRMVADVPVGAFLSGGVDSTAIVALMKQHASGPIKTFSVGFTVGGAYNELSDARRTAQYLGTDHHEIQIDSIDLVKTLRMLVYHYDEPFGDAAGFPVYLLSQFARQHVKVVLTGDGGDELFGGYRRYVIEQLAGMYQRLPGILINKLIPTLVDSLPRARRLKRTAHTLPTTDPAQRYAQWLCWFTPEMQAELLCSEILSSVNGYDPAWPYPQHYHGMSRNTANDHLNRLMYVDMKTWLVDMYMEKVDKATMAASLEARLPLLDHRLVELAFQIPSRHKIKGTSTKHILKQAVKPWMPPEVLSRPKHGFSVPTDIWFRGDLREFAFEVLLDPQTRSRRYFNMDVVERLWREHGTGRHVWDTQLWLLLNFELWHRLYLDREA